MDSFDLQILRELQANAEISMQELGEKVGLSHTPCWRRVKKLEEEMKKVVKTKKQVLV